MPRRGLSDAAKQAAALQAGQRMIARGERPVYRVRSAQDASWAVDEAPWLSVAATSRREARVAARAAIAAWLAVEPDAFDLEA